MKRLKPFFWITDIGFILYWIITGFHILPEEYLFKDYADPIISAWNWSFFPLDIAISVTGLTALFFYKKEDHRWHSMALISLILTFTSGLQAISFWFIRKDFDISWWIPNLYLLIYPLFFIPRMVQSTVLLRERKAIQ